MPNGSHSTQITPTDADRYECRLVIDHLSVNHRLYVNDYGKFNDGDFASTQLSSNAQHYLHWKILKGWYESHYNRQDFEGLPESERRSVDFTLAITLAHEFAHASYIYRNWKALFSHDPYVHLSTKFIDFGKDSWSHASRPSFAF